MLGAAPSVQEGSGRKLRDTSSPIRRGQHDDCAAALAGLVSLLGRGRDPDDLGISVGSLQGWRDEHGMLR